MLKWIGETLKKVHFPPIREVLSEDGVGSYSRYLGFWTAVFVFGWVTYIVIHNHKLPEDMTGPTTFLVGGQSAYAANQAKKVAAAVAGTKSPAPTPPGDNPA